MRFSDAPPDTQDEVRGGFGELISRQLLTTDEYAEWFEPSYGPLEWEAPAPPATSAGLEDRRSLGGDGDPTYEVVDGDTIRVYGESGPFRVRLIGINAADFNRANPITNEAAVQHKNDLRELLRNADTIELGVFEPERYGSIQEVDPRTGEVRFLMWLYVDGSPVYDPGVFSFRNPTGVSSTGAGVAGRAQPSGGGEQL